MFVPFEPRHAAFGPECSTMWDDHSSRQDGHSSTVRCCNLERHTSGRTLHFLSCTQNSLLTASRQVAQHEAHLRDAWSAGWSCPLYSWPVKRYLWAQCESSFGALVGSSCACIPRSNRAWKVHVGKDQVEQQPKLAMSLMHSNFDWRIYLVISWCCTSRWIIGWSKWQDAGIRSKLGCCTSFFRRFPKFND